MYAKFEPVVQIYASRVSGAESFSGKACSRCQGTGPRNKTNTPDVQNAGVKIISQPLNAFSLRSNNIGSFGSVCKTRSAHYRSALSRLEWDSCVRTAEPLDMAEHEA